MKHKIADYIPFGMEKKKIYEKVIVILVIPFLYTLQFIGRFEQAKSVQIRASKLSGGEEVMADFVDLLGNGFLLFPIAMVACFFLIIPLYKYHYNGSKSIYVMKRLPNPYELWRRVLTVPLCTVVLLALLALCTVMLYYMIYVIFSPAGSIASGQIEQLLYHWF